MDITDAQLLRELRRALDAVAGQGADAQAKALEETMQRLDATMPDVVRALNNVRERRRTELAGLAGSARWPAASKKPRRRPMRSISSSAV